MLIRVAVPVPQLDLLTYRVPDGTPRPTVGARVVIPLGARVVTGIVADADAPSVPTGAEVKPIQQLLDREPFVPTDIVDLATWTAEYYAAGVGETLTAVLPPNTRGQRADAHKMRRIAAITAHGLAAIAAGAEAGRPLTQKQRDALSLLAAAPEGLSTAVLAGRGLAADGVGRLVRRGLALVRQERIERDPFEARPPFEAVSEGEPRRLTGEQSRALARLQAMADTKRFRVALVHGVTGSGKSEIYVRLAAAIDLAGRRTLMLVPEIALTPAVSALFRQAFGERVAIQHSGLSDGERHDQWQRIRRGDVTVVVGTRSAVFAPLSDVGLIIVDEEHDTSYKQEESPRYNARDVAIIRGQRAHALVVLGSATPSMESYQNAMTGKYERVVLERRVFDRPLPSVTLVDMREEYAAVGPDAIFSRPLTAAIRERLERGEQTLVLLNRRGFATAVFCRQCAGTLECPNCSVSLVVHGEGPSRRARCHYCNYNARVPSACPFCAGPYLEQGGFGSERVEAEMRRICPSARVARLDRDTARRKGTIDRLLAQFRGGEIDVLVGTQMIAKGHDFPRVTLVGVISADVGLGLADFRASERTFQLIAQVSGRAGRGEQPGEAIVQTLYPGHYSIQLACTQDYRAFFERELQFRRAMRYPPMNALINAVVRGRTFSGAMEDATAIGARLEHADHGRDLRVLGPAPAPLGRLKGEHRVQLLIKGGNRKAMRKALLAAIAARPGLARRTLVDVDPLSVL